MIPYIHERSGAAAQPLAQALGRTVSSSEGLTTDEGVVAHWPGLDHHLAVDDWNEIWTTEQWAGHLNGPLLAHRGTFSPQGDRRAILHYQFRLHPDDRELTHAQWSEIGHRLARAAAVEIPGDENGCRWIAVRGQPGRLDLIANAIREDGTWQYRPLDLGPRLSDEARQIESDLRLTPRQAVAHHDDLPAPAVVQPDVSPLAGVLSQLADERTGPLATVRSLVEHSARHLAAQPQARSINAGHQLELLARRLHAVQRDLGGLSQSLHPTPLGTAPARSSALGPPRRTR